ncbi:MAG: hypothetical protein RLZZ540_2434 [Bacteroidota bacterium]
MKNFTILAFVLISFIAKAQEEVSVEKKLLGIQLGLFNTSFQYEAKLDRKITLLSEVGMIFGTSKRDYIDPNIEDEKVYVVAPFVTLEPRWYYGLDRRRKLGRNTKHNSSNYVALSTSYVSNKTPIIHSGNFDIVSALYIIPKYGIRRAFAKNFNYEFSAGLGYQYNVFSEKDGCNCDHDDTVIDIQARIGYNF